jgi:Ca2+-binding EF-hand superfamily protein
MKKVIWLVIAVFLVVPVGLALAESFHDKADTDKDGTVSREEMKKAVDERFRSEDANKDGKLTVEEYQAARQKNFNDADVNKDGSVTVEEWAIYWCGTDKDAGKVKKPVKMGKKKSRSKLMDANKDGKLGKDECVLFWSGRFVDIDGNKDGKLSREEYMDRMKEMVKTMDIDGDGVVTIEEYYVSWLGDSTKASNKPAGTQKKPAAKDRD